MNRIICFLSLALLLSSCSEETRINEVSGFIYQDCSNKPYANAEIALRSNVGQAFDEIRIIGAATSNSYGKFQFTYELEEEQTGTVDLILVRTDGFLELLTNLDANIDISTNIYVPNISTLFVNLSGTKIFSSTDTLFLGVSESNVSSYLIQPLAGRVDTLHIEVPNQYGASDSQTFYYGVGMSQFQASKDALGSNTPIRHINLELTGCNKEDLVDLVID